MTVFCPAAKWADAARLSATRTQTKNQVISELRMDLGSTHMDENLSLL
jgi:hypothetical protein